MIRSIVLALAATAAVLGATTAHAGGVSWSIGINTPPVEAVFANGPGYYAPVYVAPGYRQGDDRGYGRVYGDDRDYGRVYAPVPVYAPAPVYIPAPVYRVPPRVAYYPPVVSYRPVPIAYPRHHPGWRHGNDRWDGHGRH